MGPNPATRAEGVIELNYPRIFEAAGLPPELIRPDVVDHYLPLCTAATFSDGELAGVHLPMEDPVMQKHFGRDRYEEGALGARLIELFNDSKDRPMQQQVDRLVRNAGIFLARSAIKGDLPPLPPSVVVDVATSTLSFDRDHSVPLAEPPQVVMDFGPGTKGRYHIHQQIKDMTEGRQTYSYFAIGKGPLIPRFLSEYWVQLLDGSQEAFDQMIIGKYLIPREDGMAAGSKAFIDIQRAQNGPVEAVDVAIASAVHTAGEKELATTFINTHKFLKPEGTLIIRAPKDVKGDRPDSVPAAQMVELVRNAGFSLSRAEFYDVTTGGGPLSVAPLTDSLAAVFRK
jgi:hypothetical protein